MSEALPSKRSRRPPRIPADMRRTRTCYDHLAGEIGVAIADELLSRGAVVLDGQAAEVTPAGHAFFARLGIDLAGDGKLRRALCRPCMDLSERRPHLAGRVGAALCACCLNRGWLARRAGSRTLDISPLGANALPKAFGASLAPLCGAAQPIVTCFSQTQASAARAG